MRNEKKLNSIQYKEYDFFQLVELVQGLIDSDPDSEEWEVNCQILFGGDPSLGFAVSEVSDFNVVDERVHIQTTFFGLNGAHSPLPSYLIEQVATEGENGLRRHLLDFFNHRLNSLLYRIWRKYRYYIRFKEGAADRFSSQMLSLVGLGDDKLRGETPIQWCKMLAYAGMLAGRSRSPQVVSGIIAHCFDLTQVTIREWEKRRVAIPKNQRAKLGLLNGILGENIVIGSKVLDCTSKFTICIGELSNERFLDFLPEGKDYQALYKLIEFILREPMAIDLELELKSSEAPPMILDKNSKHQLGWTSFVGDVALKRQVSIQLRK